MAKLNTARNKIFTYEGAVAKHINPLQQLRRSVMACLLWEQEFYENGETIAGRIKMLVPQCKAEDVAALAVEARTEHNMRHVSLLLAREMARNFNGAIVGKTISKVIQRADELTEFLAIYWKDGKQPLSAQTKRGLAHAWTHFSEYHLAKYNRDGAVKLKDSLFLCHAKPKDKAQEALWKRLINDELQTPDTWEVALSSGADKRITFERMLQEKTLGYFALLRNLRNMADAKVDRNLVERALIQGAGKSRILPFRYLSAARACPQWEPMIDRAMISAMQEMPKLPGKTLLLVDVSGSMDFRLSSKSDLARIDTAAALAVLLAGIAEDFEVHTFSRQVVLVPPRQGMALVDAIGRSQAHGGTDLGLAVREANTQTWDRLIVITDEQSHTRVPDPMGRAYMINVASAKNGVGYGPWIHIDGFSEAVIKYIQLMEATNEF